MSKIEHVETTYQSTPEEWRLAIKKHNIKRGTVLVYGRSGPGWDPGYNVVIDASDPEKIKCVSVDYDPKKLDECNMKHLVYIQLDYDIYVSGWGEQGNLGELRELALSLF